MAVIPFRRTRTQRLAAAARMLGRMRREAEESPKGKEMRRRYEEEMRARASTGSPAPSKKVPGK